MLREKNKSSGLPKVGFVLRRAPPSVKFAHLKWTEFLRLLVPAGSPSRGGELAHSFLFCSCVYFCLYGPFNCISFHKFSRQLSVFWPRSSGLISALPVLSTIYLFMKVSFSPDMILCGWLGLEHQLTNVSSKIFSRNKLKFICLTFSMSTLHQDYSAPPLTQEHYSFRT